MSKMIETFKMLKEKHSDVLILFRVGDFYESYFEDAKKVSEVLGVTLTENEKDDIFITSFPTQSLDTYLPKLIRAGIRVAICDDISEPIKLKKRGSDETTQEPQVEDADTEEIMYLLDKKNNVKYVDAEARELIVKALRRKLKED